MKKLFREPLVHFLLLGMGIFLLYGLVNKSQDDSETIIIDDYDLNNIIASWEMQWKRLPTDDELKNLIQQNIKQEIFYQEALKMNLDHNDEIIKRRLAQKMQFLSNDLASINEPTDKELQNYFDANFENYLSPYVFSFYQIIFSPDDRKNAREDAEQFKSRISDLSLEEVKTKGDPLPFPFLFEDANADAIDRQLGANFSKSLEPIKTESWAGPIQSGFGYHLVYVTKKIGPQLPDWELVRDDILRDMTYTDQKKLNDMILVELKKNYTIEFDLDPNKFDQEFVDFLKEEELN